jgi:hypothetical protein
MSENGDHSVHPADSGRWRDLASLFGPNGASEGCWCMLWRIPGSEWVKGKRDGNRAQMRELVTAGPPPGLLAYEG